MQSEYNADQGQAQSHNSSVFPILPKTGLSVLEMGEEATNNLFYDMGDLIPPEFRGVLPKDGTDGFKVGSCFLLHAKVKTSKR